MSLQTVEERKANFLARRLVDGVHFFSQGGISSASLRDAVEITYPGSSYLSGGFKEWGRRIRDEYHRSKKKGPRRCLK